MAANVGQLSTDELREIIGSVVEQKLKEMLGDPDEGFEIRAEVQNRLLRQKKTSLTAKEVKNSTRLLSGWVSVDGNVYDSTIEASRS